MELVKTSKKTVQISKPMSCPDCGMGHLQRLQPAFITSPVFDYDTMVNEAKSANISIDGSPYIGCTGCDFMGSPNDAIAAIRVKETATKRTFRKVKSSKG